MALSCCLSSLYSCAHVLYLCTQVLALSCCQPPWKFLLYYYYYYCYTTCIKRYHYCSRYGIVLLLAPPGNCRGLPYSSRLARMYMELTSNMLKYHHSIFSPFHDYMWGLALARFLPVIFCKSHGKPTDRILLHLEGNSSITSPKSYDVGESDIWPLNVYLVCILNLIMVGIIKEHEQIFEIIQQHKYEHILTIHNGPSPSLAFCSERCCLIFRKN